MSTLLSLHDVHVSYGRIAALRGVTLDVPHGEVVGIIGANGAGKSTTLKTIVGLLTPTEGDLQFEGRDIASMSPEQMVRAGVALVPEGRRIFAGLTVHENLLMGSMFRRDAETRRTLAELLERFEVLAQYRDTPAGRLSGGEQQQLAIARALVSRPKLLLLDEPSLGLAPLLVDRVFETLAGLRDEGMTVVLVEQQARRTVEFADRTYVLSGGTVALQGSRGELLGRDSAEIEAVYLGADVEVRA
jgi:branched-chain amino acid transport system ATP-binding protein